MWKRHSSKVSWQHFFGLLMLEGRDQQDVLNMLSEERGLYYLRKILFLFFINDSSMDLLGLLRFLFLFCNLFY